MDSYQKRRKPGYYSNNKPKRSKHIALESDMKGFICTCNENEKSCVKEAYNILNEFADQLYGSEWECTQKCEKEGTKSDDDDDIDSSLQNEIAAMKSEKEKDPKLRRFQLVDAGVRNCLFIRTTLSEPAEVVTKILNDLEINKKQKSRYLLRMLPIESTCKAYFEELKAKCAVIFDKYFIKEPKTFSIIFNRRNSNLLHRDDVIAELAEMIKERNIANTVDLKNAELTVVIEVIRSICCIGVLSNYAKLRKYNLVEICSTADKKDATEKTVDTSIDKTSATPDVTENTVDTSIDKTSATPDVTEKTVDTSIDKTSATPDVSSNQVSGDENTLKANGNENLASSNICVPDSSNDPSCGEVCENPHSE